MEAPLPLLLADSAETLDSVAGTQGAGERVASGDLPAEARTLWRTFSDAEDAWALRGAFPGSGFRHVVAIGSAIGSQFDLLQSSAGRELRLSGPVACIALEGRGFHGQRGRAWSAERGNVHLSVAIPASLPVETHALALTMLPALAALDAVRAVTGGGLEVGIKWVNDVLVGGKKIAGVLTATQITRRIVEQIVFGVGLNVLRAPSLRPSPFVVGTTSLAEAAPELGLTLRDVLPPLLLALDRRYRMLLDGGPTLLFRAYRESSIVIGRAVRIYSESLRDDRAPEDWPAPLARGVVRDLGPDLALHLEGCEEPVRAGRLAFEEACRAYGLGE